MKMTIPSLPFIKSYIMKQTIKYLAIAGIGMATLSMSCKKTKDPQGSGVPAANMVKGNIFDAKGNKYALDNSNVLVHVTGTGQNNNAYHISMDNTSHYEKEVATGLYTFNVRAWTSLNGKVISVPLDPADGKPSTTQFNSANGITRDFRLKLTGLVPGGDPAYADSYYGGKIAVCDGAYFFGQNGTTNNLGTKYPGATVMFILTPKSLCIDGSTAQIAQINIAVEDLRSSSEYLVNFPLARYYLSALLKKATGQQIPLKLNFTNAATGAHYDFLDISFSPATNDQDCNPGIPRGAVWEN